MRNIELRISYMGGNFSGWQIQPEARTVQGVIKNRLQRIFGDAEIKVVGCSRTDTGVHAHDQRVGFKTRSTIPLDGLRRLLNGILPDDVRVRTCHERSAEFSVRRDARAKHYSYFVFNQRCASPFVTPFVWTYGRKLDVVAMQEAAQHFVGHRCFKSLQAAADIRTDTMSLIFDTEVGRRGEIVYFHVLGQHFLYHMVRNMMGALLMVGWGEWSPDELGRRMESGERTLMGMTAPAMGLHLMEVFFGEGPFKLSPRGDAFLNYLSYPDEGFF